ncbi:hypothetical protein TNIN_210101 [Trichonephila inaurata madagascariensis]|uniref:Uncharacterized protein n=1 Tax=Trichonephila inaurata madagascariensis TaxID=2747483 RepID=A0A8X7C8S8_9ARAC|nr:hypothetical protein TNIN_210101 [Trichonephila inaurata madagascariensis]
MVAESFLGRPLSFLGIISHILIMKLMKTLFLSYCERRNRIERNNLIAEANKQKRRDPVVNSWMINKMCEALELKAQFVAVPNRITWVTKRQKKEKSIVYSETILNFCETLNLNAQLSTSTGREQPQPKFKHQSKRTKPLPVVQSFTIYKMCEALGLEAKLNT